MLMLSLPPLLSQKRETRNQNDYQNNETSSNIIFWRETSNYGKGMAFPFFTYQDGNDLKEWKQQHSFFGP
jgi:hypothetical protein